MTTIEQFMTDYFRERTKLYRAELELLAPLRQAYFTPDCRFDSRQGSVERSEAEKIVSTSQEGEEILVIATSRHGRDDKLARTLRYHLHQNGESWRIHQVELECPSCHGTGMALSEHCRFCGGKGWR
jgi:hypothetical protein